MMIALKRVCCMLISMALFSAVMAEQLPSFSMAGAESEYNQYGEYEIREIQNGNCALVSCNTGKNVLSIPCSINGMPVRIIENGCFQQLHNLWHIVIPSSVYTIQSNAFSNSVLMQTIVIPETVQVIEPNAFDVATLGKNFCIITANGSAAYDYCVQNNIKCKCTRESRLCNADESFVRMAGFVRIPYNLNITPEGKYNNLASDVISELSYWDAIQYGIADRKKYVSDLLTDIFTGEVDTYIKDVYLEQIAILLASMYPEENGLPSDIFDDAEVISEDFKNIATLEDYWDMNDIFDDPKAAKSSLEALQNVCRAYNFGYRIYKNIYTDFEKSIETLKLLQRLQSGTSYPEAWWVAVNELRHRYSNHFLNAVVEVVNELKEDSFAVAEKAIGGLYEVANIILDTGVALFGLKEKSKNFMALAICVEMDSYFYDQYNDQFQTLNKSDSMNELDLIDLELLFNLFVHARLQLFDAELKVAKDSTTLAAIRKYKKAYADIVIDPAYYDIDICYGEGSLLTSNYDPTVDTYEDTADTITNPETVEPGPLFYKWNEYAEMNLWGDEYVNQCSFDWRSGYTPFYNFKYRLDGGTAVGELGSFFGNQQTDDRSWLLNVNNPYIGRWGEDVLQYIVQNMDDSYSVNVIDSELYSWYMGQDGSYTMTSSEEFYEVLVTAYSMGMQFDIMLDMTGTYDEGEAVSCILIDAQSIYSDDEYYNNYEYNNVDNQAHGTSDDDGFYYYGSNDYMGAMTVVNCDKWVSLRVQPDSSSERITTVPLGATVDAFYYNSEWYECYYKGQWGYILSKYLY